MAVASDGFSIREYASKTRTVDVLKCWPFGGDSDDIDKEVVEALLPPITVKKFRWWSEELELLQSKSNPDQPRAQEHESEIPRDESEIEKKGEKSETLEQKEEILEMVCPVCRVFAAATVNAVNAHVDNCLASTSKEDKWPMKKVTKPKSKAPKKRSIADIFAVAPPIETTVIDDDEDDTAEKKDDVEKDKASRARNFASTMKRIKAKKKLKKKMIKRRVSLDESTTGLPVVNMLKKKQEKFKKRTRDWSIAKKAVGHELKLLTAVNRKRNLNGTPCNRRLTMECKPCLKNLSTQKRHKLVQTSKSTAKHQKPAAPAARRILKNRLSEVSELNSPISISQDCNPIHYSSSRQSDKHVTFSGKDDILGPRKRSSSNVHERNVRNLCTDSFVASSENNQSRSNQEEIPTEINGIGPEVQPIIGKTIFPDIHDHIGTTTFPIPHFPNMSISANQVAIRDNDKLCLFGQGYSAASSTKPANLGISRLPDALEERPNLGAKSPSDLSVSRFFNSFADVDNNFVDPNRGASAMSSLTSKTAFSPPSLSYFPLNRNADWIIPHLSKSAAENSGGRDIQYQPYRCSSPIEMIGKSCPFPNWNQSVLSCRDQRYTQEDFFGLPLNSQGELIPMSSNATVNGFDQLRESCKTTGCSCGLFARSFFIPRSSRECLSTNEKHFVDREVPGNHLNLFPLQSNVKENQNEHLPARLGINESNLNSMNFCFNGCRMYDQVENQNRNTDILSEEQPSYMSVNSTQPTMRLMGKDVTIGKSSNEMQISKGGKFWNGKEILTEFLPASNNRDDASLNRNFWENLSFNSASGKQKPLAVHGLGIQTNQSLHCNLPMKAPPQSRFSLPCLNQQSHIESQNGYSTLKENPSFRGQTFSHPPTHSPMFDMAPSFQQPFIDGTENLRVDSRLPPVVLDCMPNLPPPTKSAFNFPFLHPDCGEHVHLSCVWNSKSLPSWMLQAKQKEKAQPITSQLLNGRYGESSMLLTSGTDIVPITTTSAHALPEFSYPFSPLPSHLQSASSMGLTPMFHHQLVSIIPDGKPTSTINIRNRIKVRDILKSNTLGIKDSHPLKLSKKKRPATKPIDPRKPAKIPNLEVTESSGPTGFTRGNLDNELQYKFGALDLDLNKDKPCNSVVGSCSNETLKDGMRSSEPSNINSYRVDNMARSGPTKLSAGAKHILKPSQHTDHLDNLRPTHSTIPFTELTSSVIVPEPREKSTKIYRF